MVFLYIKNFWQVICNVNESGMWIRYHAKSVKRMHTAFFLLAMTVVSSEARAQITCFYQSVQDGAWSDTDTWCNCPCAFFLSECEVDNPDFECQFCDCPGVPRQTPGRLDITVISHNVTAGNIETDQIQVSSGSLNAESISADRVSVSNGAVLSVTDDMTLTNTVQVAPGGSLFVGGTLSGGRSRMGTAGSLCPGTVGFFPGGDEPPSGVPSFVSVFRLENLEFLVSGENATLRACHIVQASISLSGGKLEVGEGDQQFELDMCFPTASVGTGAASVCNQNVGDFINNSSTVQISLGASLHLPGDGLMARNLLVGPNASNGEVVIDEDFTLPAEYTITLFEGSRITIPAHLLPPSPANRAPVLTIEGRMDLRGFDFGEEPPEPGVVDAPIVVKAPGSLGINPGRFRFSSSIFVQERGWLSLNGGGGGPEEAQLLFDARPDGAFLGIKLNLGTLAGNGTIGPWDESRLLGLSVDLQGQASTFQTSRGSSTPGDRLVFDIPVINSQRAQYWFDISTLDHSGFNFNRGIEFLILGFRTVFPSCDTSAAVGDESEVFVIHDTPTLTTQVSWPGFLCSSCGIIGFLSSGEQFENFVLSVRKVAVQPCWRSGSETGGIGDDIDGNGVSDEFEPDRNHNGMPDSWEADCDGDGLPDSAESDQDGDFIPDDCDGSPVFMLDCDSDGVPDDEELDANANGVPDDCEVDCDGDGIPNELEPDCDDNGLPDVCELDSDLDGVPNACDNCPLVANADQQTPPFPFHNLCSTCEPPPSDEGLLTFVSPALGTTITAGDTIMVEWISEIASGFVCFNLYMDCDWFSFIGCADITDEVFTWNVCPMFPDRVEYRLRATTFNGPGTNSEPFEISGSQGRMPIVALTSPSADDQLELGSTTTIEWQHLNDVGQVNVILFRQDEPNLSFIQQLGFPEMAAGSIPWLIDATLQPGRYRMQISDSQQCGNNMFGGEFELISADIISGDLDGDGQVNMVDIGLFQNCFTGEGGGPIELNCELADLDGDDDVDLVDFAAVSWPVE